MTATLLWGKEAAAEIRAQAKERFDRIAARGVQPGLAIVTVGETPAGNPYVRSKSRAAQELGVRASVERLPGTTSEDALHAKLRGLSENRDIHGIILQLPLPSHLHEDLYLEDIAPIKDVDGLHPRNVGRWVHGLPAHRPATPLGVLELLRRHCGDLAGKRAVVIGRSRIVGRPLSVFLSERSPGLNATVTLCHSATRDLKSVAREGEILVVAIGRRRAITSEYVRPGAVVIDVGIHPIPTPDPGGPRFEGDVDMDSVRPVASAVTPVPGGVGPMTVAFLLRNLADAVEAQEGAG
ncbi:MAG: bifunctional 5,10-methylenetetrahydrofolate dehydrogenase/5,10-methenyltetrahydrofolate cyclohydrolase [Candidatus Eisenbacteria bacterium]|uniref:Bifunctional protein FolD n=1 Tax=Eiseniibacteriota bacterium TaxID=2212470 RepID=A0A538T2U1_UNCEI|nr:MAG: bifunctional 5,10-methylenetetrahydrofolate dehydrogenase/5,10-methenyltetrahydrofolate cyclohydrolase [Candidatus Eisenbacteria bacterium]